MHIKKYFIKLNISKKLIIAYIAVMAVPLIIISIFGFRNFKNKVEDTKLQENQYLLDEEKENIENNINTMEIAAEQVVSDKKLLEFINTDTEISNEESIEYNFDIANNVQSIQSNNPSINRIKFYMSQNNYIPDIWPYLYHEDSIRNKKWYDSVIQGKGKEYWVVNNIDDENYNVTREKDNVVSVYRSVNIPSDNHIGIVEVNMISKDFFRKVFNEVNQKESQFIVIDSSGNVVANNGFLKQNKIPYSHIKNLFDNHKSGKLKGNFTVNEGQNTLMISYQYLDSIQSYMLDVDSFKEGLKSIYVNKNEFIYGTILLMILLSVVVYAITSYILKGLKTITKELKKMRKGDFNIDLPISSNDEVGELAHHFRQFSNKINELVSDKIEKETIVKEAELKALKNQIDAHFLYNVLENIKMMAEIDEEYQISDAVTSLGNLMRYNMKWDGQFVTLKEEIDYIKDYVALMNIRFNNNIELYLNVNDDVLKCRILKMSLQPIIENSIKHGLRDKISENFKGKITINAGFEGDNIRCEIIDNGIGIAKNELEVIREKFKVPDINVEGCFKNKDALGEHIVDQKGGIGLKNVYERIRLFLGNDYKIDIYSELGKYTKVILKLPINM